MNFLTLLEKPNCTCNLDKKYYFSSKKAVTWWCNSWLDLVGTVAERLERCFGESNLFLQFSYLSEDRHCIQNTWVLVPGPQVLMKPVQVSVWLIDRIKIAQNADINCEILFHKSTGQWNPINPASKGPQKYGHINGVAICIKQILWIRKWLTELLIGPE